MHRGDYLHAAAEQGPRDVAVTLSDAAGRPLLTIDSLIAARPPWPPEEVHWVAAADGVLRLDAARLDGAAGPCPIRLLERRPATAGDRERAAAEAALAEAHARRRQNAEASCRAGAADYARADTLFARLALPRRRAETLLGLGMLDADCLGEKTAALAALRRAEPLFAGDEAGEAAVRERLGELHFARGDLDAAIDSYRRALAARRRLGDRTGEALTSNNLGHALDLRGRYDEAAALFDRALALWAAGDNPAERARTSLNRGELDRELGAVERARARFGEALALFRRARDHAGEAAALNALGLIALDAGQPRAALAPLASALALRRPGTRGRAVTLTTLGVADRQLGQLDDARRAYAEASPIFHRLGDGREEARSLGNLGWLEATAGADDAALADFDRALALPAAATDPPARAWMLRGRAAALRHRGDLPAARQAMEAALAAVERHRFRQRSYDTRAAFFSTQQDAYDFLIDLLMEMHRGSPGAGFDAAALAVAERAFARSLLDELAASGTDPHHGAAPALFARQRALEEEIDALAGREAKLGQDLGVTGEQLRPLQSLLARRWEQLDRVQALLRAASPRYAALTQPRPWSAGEVQRRLLDRDTLLLEYRLGAERSFVWAVTPEALASFALPGRAAIEALAARAADLAARSRGRQVEIAADQQLAKLARVLLAPVAGLLPGKRLLVVGDGILQRVPFAALPDPAGGEPLVARHEIVSLPSISVLGILRQEVGGRTPAPKTLWVLADPAFGGAFAPLPHTRQEAAAILALAPPGGRAALLGAAASRAAVLGAALGDYRYLHFATHGSFTAGGAGGRLVLAQLDGGGRRLADGFLDLADIYDLDLRADLVVLSACQSALGREVRGEGIMGMTRGFFYAGAERVLVSLWNVNDRASAELMRRFYRGMLEERLPPPAALRAAQDSIRREERYRSPYFWAGFVLQGEWRDTARPGGLNPP